MLIDSPILGPDLRSKPIATILGLVFFPPCLTGEGPKGEASVYGRARLQWLCFANICPFLHGSDPLILRLHNMASSPWKPWKNRPCPTPWTPNFRDLCLSTAKGGCQPLFL